MSDPTAEFFGTLEQHRYERFLEPEAGTIRFDLTGERETEHWFMEISHGGLRISRDARAADCVIRADRSLFDKVVTGETNFIAAWLRYEIVFEGNTRVASFFQRFLPDSPGSRHPRRDRGDVAG